MRDSLPDTGSCTCSRLRAPAKDVLLQLAVPKLDYVLVSVGSSIASSRMTGICFKGTEVQTGLAKTVRRDHRKLPRTVGVEILVIPEVMAAKRRGEQLAQLEA